MVFMGTSMRDNIRTPEGDKKLKKLEQKLMDLRLVTTPELGVLCSCTYRPHLERPFRVSILLPQSGPSGEKKISSG